MERTLIQYLPFVVREYAQMKGIMESEQPIFEKAWDEAKRVLDNQFIFTADELGIQKWEAILNIMPKGTETLEERRFRILSRYNEQLPYTLKQLRAILETLCGKGNYTTEIAEGSYILIVRVGLAAKSNFQDVETLLHRVTPQNLIIQLNQMYNTHKDLAQFTHKYLSQYTQDQLRNEVLT